MALVAFIGLFFAIVILPMIITQVIKARILFPPDPEIHFENEVERTLNEAVADEKFEATLQRTIAQKRAISDQAYIRTPEEEDYRIAPRRDRVHWQPTIPGILHEEDRNWTM